MIEAHQSGALREDPRAVLPQGGEIIQPRLEHHRVAAEKKGRYAGRGAPRWDERREKGPRDDYNQEIGGQNEDGNQGHGSMVAGNQDICNQDDRSQGDGKRGKRIQDDDGTR